MVSVALVLDSGKHGMSEISCNFESFQGTDNITFKISSRA